MTRMSYMEMHNSNNMIMSNNSTNNVKHNNNIYNVAPIK